MTTILVAFLLSFLVSVVLTRVMMAVGWKLNILDRPDGYRKIHTSPTPRFGGPAIFVAFVAPLMGLYLFPELSAISEHIVNAGSRPWGLIVGACLALGLGAVDDVLGLRPVWKVVWQIVIATVMYYFGYTISGVSSPFGGEFELGNLAYPLTVFWFVACMNAVNLLDGIDGLAAGTCVFVGLTLFLVCMSFQNVFGMLLMACFSASAIGFLVFNFPPARIFLGDSGSLLLGFLIAALSLVGAAMKTSTAVALFVPMVALGLPILDTSLAILRRWYRRLPLSAPDQEHIHHVLVSMGYSPRRAVLILYAACLLLGGFALLIALGKSEVIILVVGSLAVMITVSVRIFSRITVHDLVEKIQQDGARKVIAARARNTLEKVVSRLQSAGSTTAIWSACAPLFVELGIDRAKCDVFCGPDGGETSMMWSVSPVPDVDLTVQDSCSIRLVLWHRNMCVGALSVETSRPVGSSPSETGEILDRLRSLLAERLYLAAQAVSRSARKPSNPPGGLGI